MYDTRGSVYPKLTYYVMDKMTEKVIKVCKNFEDAHVEAHFLKEMDSSRKFIILHIVEDIK